MRKILPVLLALVVVVGCASEPKEFKSEAGNFSVMTPVTMEESTQTQPTAAGPLQMHLFGGENRSAAYMVMYFDIEKNLLQNARAEDMLNGGRDGEIRSMGGTLKSSKATTLDGAPGVEYVFTGKVKDVPYEGSARVFLIGNRIYHMLVLNKESKATAEQVDNFLNSFKVLKK